MRSLSLLILLCAAPLLADITVERIEWKSDLPLDDFARLIKIEPGAPLSVKSVRRTVRLLYATGRFEQVVVTLLPGPDPERRAVSIAATPLRFIEDITITGNGALSDNRIKLAGNLRRFSPFYESGLERIREEILATYRSEGYPDATLSIEARNRSAAEVDILLSIQEGERRRIKKILLTGEVLSSERRELVNDLTLSNAFAALTDEQVRTMQEQVEHYYRGRGHLDTVIRHQTQDDGTVVFTVQRGPRYTLSVAGANSFSAETIRRVIQHIEGWHRNNEAANDRVILFYQAAGFPDVTVRTARTVKKRGTFEETLITVSISEGPRRFIDGIVFSGALEEKSEDIAAHIVAYVETRLDAEDLPPVSLDRTIVGGGYRDTDGARVTTLSRTNKDRASFPDARYVVPAAYLPDIATQVVEFYKARGYLQAEVLGHALARDGDLLFLDIEIAEGERSLVNWVDISSGDPELDRELLSLVDARSGIPFTPAFRDEITAKISTRLRELGRSFSRVTVETVADGAHVRLLFRVDDAFPVQTGEVVVSGNIITEGSVVRRLTRIATGDLLTSDLLREARQDLLATGAFDTAELTIMDEDAPEHMKDIVITVIEAWRYRLEIGAGVATDEGGRLFGSFEYKNVLGQLFSLRLSILLAHKIPWFMNSAFEDYFLHDLSFFERFDRVVNGSIAFPDLYFLPFSLAFQAEAFHIHDSRTASGLPYLLDKNGMLLSFYKRFGEHFVLWVNAELSRQDEEEYKELYDETTASSTVSLERSTRYLLSPEVEGWADYRNSPVSPDRGFKIGLRVRNVSSLAGDNTQYTLLENYASVYLPLQYLRSTSGEYLPRDTVIWHSFLRYGALLLHDGMLSADDTLKLGGSTSVRGFAQNSIIPADDTDGDPQGKYYLFLRNELRLKIQDHLYFVAFFDAGNLWEDIRQVGVGDLLRFGTGGGFMYASPIGSIHLQAGVNPFPREDTTRDYREDLWSFHFFISSF